MKNKKKIILLILIIALVGILGITYAIFDHRQTGTTNEQLIAGDIYMHYLENNTLIIQNAMPRSSYDSNVYFEFSVDGKNTTTNHDIIYDIQLIRGDVPQGKQEANRLDDKDIRFRLVSVSNNVETEIFTNRGYVDLTEAERIHTETIPRNTASEISHVYRLYMWIDNGVIVGNTARSMYTMSEWTNIFASVKVNVTGDFASKELKDSLNEKIHDEYTNGATYIKSYNTEVRGTNPSYTTQDTVGTNANKQDVLYYTGTDALSHGNVLFGGYCWQIIRTTDTGGIKMIYNGPAVNDQCGDRSGTTFKGINATNSDSVNVSSETIFGTGYDYNLATGTFTLTGTSSLSGKTWANNSSELIGTYSCLNGTNSCTTLYYIGHVDSPTNSLVAQYTIGNISSYTVLGTSFYNAYQESPSLAGYMFNRVYQYRSDDGTPSGTFANDVSWDGTSYVLSANTTSSFDVTHHYLCDDNNCNKVRYYFILQSGGYYYVILENGENIETALKNMINYKTNQNEANASINVYSSAIKGYIDNWYKKNILETSFEKYIDTSAVYCSDRSIANLGGWNKNSSSISGTSAYLLFNQNSVTQNLACNNLTDRMSVISGEAQLTYAIGLLTEPERGIVGQDYLATGVQYWTSTPRRFTHAAAQVRTVHTNGAAAASGTVSYGVRPVITLSSLALVTDGSGSTSNPYVVGPLV